LLDCQSLIGPVFAGDELRKYGGKKGPAQVAAPNQPKPQRAPNLGIRSALKHGRTATGRKHRTRPIQGIAQNVKINRALWMLAEGMKRIKA